MKIFKKACGVGMFIRKRLLLLYFAVAALLVALMMVAGNPVFSKDRELRLQFADNFISYAVDDENGAVFNLFAVQDVRNRNVPLEDLITLVQFANPNIEVVDFKVDTGMVHKGYKLVNLRLTARVLTDELERDNKLKIWFGNEKTATYRFGELVVQNGTGFQDGHFVPTGSYTAAYPSAGLDVRIKNISGQEATGLKIEDLSGEITHLFEGDVKIGPGKVEHFEIEGYGETEYDFATITPILSYQLGGQEYSSYMPGVLYGAMLTDKEKIEKILE
ncbi:hypothetical protein [Neobacillus piezotolerans]|uniref:hypothetical protein n=1 Tax=Neobacillus piezotolerans TaxID=2259171 RepID=UPI001CA397B2|nr:hypothetical protein [Neobacillus piezotolerans]